MLVEGTDAPAGRAPSVRHSGRIVPFWVLQAAEILSVLALADLSLHVSRGGLLIGVGVVFVLLGLTADGPLGIVRLCKRKLNTRLVIGAAIVAALLPIAPMLRPDIEGIIILEFVAVGFIRLATLVNTDLRPVRIDKASGPGSATGTMTSTARGASALPGAISNLPPAGSRSPTMTSLGAVARVAGRATGAATVAASRTAAKHGPEAKAQAKRTIRGAGRIAGKAGHRPGGRSGPPTSTPR